MSSSFEKSVKGGTKVKLAAPKSKYVEHILSATHTGEAGVAEVFRTLTLRIRDTTWTIVFKALIITHLMIKEGSRDVTLSYLSQSPKTKLAVNGFTEVQTQGQNIIRYANYLIARAVSYGHTKCDFVRSGDGRLRRATVDKGLLRETESVQDQIRALLKCDLLQTEHENEITLTAFRLLTRDLLDLYNVENEAVMNVLSRYFEMSRPDAERAIKIYKKFCTQTDQVVQYLSVARQYEHATRLEVPRIKHAPTSLVNSLQEYLDDKDFDVNRRQYLAEQDGRKSGKPVQKAAQTQSQPKAQPAASSAGITISKEAEALFNTPSQPSASQSTAKGPAPDLIDFFESIEQNQQPMAQSVPQFQQQPTGFPEQQQQQPQQQFGFAPQQAGFQQDPSQNANGFQTGQTNPFFQQLQMQQQQQPPPQQQSQPQPLQTQFTGAGFGGYGPQPPQEFVQGNAFDQNQQQQQQQFASPMQTQSPAQMQPPQQQMQAQQTNPFRQSVMPSISESGQFAAVPQQSSGQFSTQPQQQTNLQRQSTNHFARQVSPQPTFSPQPQQQQQPPQQQGSPFSTQPMQSQPTGTNPFARPQQTASPSIQQQPNALQVQPTGSTNPFRQSTFVNQQTGAGWQNSQQATMGGWENMETIPVFPRPGQPT